MEKIIINSIVIGLITSILGSVLFKYLLKIFTKEDNNSQISYLLKKYSNNFILEISLFLLGMIIHLLLEYFGFNKWYCEKKCIEDVCIEICAKKK